MKKSTETPRPNVVRMFGKNVSLTYVPEGLLEFTNYGVSMHERLAVAVRDELPLALEQEVVLHELTHFISLFMNLDLTEHQVTAQSVGLMQLFHDNPEILDYFKRA